MKQIEKIISPLVQSHFPDFYREEGPKFIDFVKQYYAWLEAQQGALNASRSLFDYRDVDTTSPEFIEYFKRKYLNGFPLATTSNTSLLTKHAIDFYNAKGTEQGVKLLIQGLYNEPASVYFPGTDMLRASDGKWVKPIYLELSVSERTKTFVGTEIVGSDSGAKAFMESLVKRRIGSKYQEVAYLSNQRGDFQTGEYITNTIDSNLANAPKVTGSMTTLAVVDGGRDFAIGDIFDVISSNGKQGKARVTEISTQTGTVTFIYVDALTSGGWGYDIDSANAIISSKVFTVGSLINPNTYITAFKQFEQLSQNLVSVSYSTARPNNANYSVGAVIENYDGTGTAVANAIIVSSTKTDNTSGTVIISPQTGNVSAVDTVFAIKGTGTSATFNANSGVANATEIITTSSSHGFTNGDILVYKLLTGNTSLSALSVGAAYYAVNAIGTTLQLSNSVNGTPLNLTAGLNQSGHVLTKSLGSGVIISYSDISATGNVVGYTATSTTSGFLGITAISSNNFIATPYANIVGSISNTSATISTVGTGVGADFNIGLLTDTENVTLPLDHLSDKNTQNVTFSSIYLNGNNSGASLQYGSPITLSNGNTAYGGFGFIKFPASNLDSILLNCFRFDNYTLGSIASIVGVNQGSDYNVDPFVVVYEQNVAGYNRRDYIMEITPNLGAFIEGEQIQQTYDLPAVQLTVNTFSGTAANGTVTTSVVSGEFVYQSNATTNVVASGIVLEAGITAGSGTIKLGSVNGTFVVTSSVPTKIKSLTSGGIANVQATALTTSATVARALVKQVDNSSQLFLKRINLENTFQVGQSIIGRSSGATGIILNVVEDSSTLPIGLNANIVANVQTSNNVVTRLAVQDSGFGYVKSETVTLTKEDSPYEVTAIVGLGKQGIGAGFYSTTDGFIDADKKLQDNNYYQTFSYEVQTKIPFDQYVDILKQVSHIAGTKPFGLVDAISTANVHMTVINSIEIL